MTAGLGAVATHPIQISPSVLMFRVRKSGPCRHSRQPRGSKFAVIKARNKLFDDLANSDDEVRSGIELYENGVRLGPARSNHSDVANLDRGRLSRRHDDVQATILIP